MPDAELNIRLIEPGDSFSGLSLGDQKFTPLKTFAQRHAARYHSKNLARTYGAFWTDNPNKVVGYMTLACGEITAEDQLRADGEDFKYDHFPAVKLARLAVDRRQRGTGIGYQLVLLAIGIAKDIICPAVGCRFVTLDSKPDSVDFYKRQGFVLLDTDENRTRANPIMFFDLNRGTADTATAATTAPTEAAQTPALDVPADAVVPVNDDAPTITPPADGT